MPLAFTARTFRATRWLLGTVLALALAAPAAPAATLRWSASATRLSAAQPTAHLRLDLTRAAVHPVRAISVTLQFTGPIALAGNESAFVEGDFLAAHGSTFHGAIDRGGGAWTFDCALLGEPCGAAGDSGSVVSFDVVATGATGTGTVSVSDVQLRDCDNDTLECATAAESLFADVVPPALALLSPAGGESWDLGATQTLQWAASDAGGVASVDLLLSRDGGATFPDTIAVGLPNAGAYDWTPLVPPSANARVRVVARDLNANASVASSASDFALVTPVTVTGLQVTHHDGQSFIHWSPPPGSGWRYRVYGGSAPIRDGGSLVAAQLLATVGDSTAYDARLSSLLGDVRTYRTDSSAAFLPAGDGLLVVTATAAGPRWYAVTCDHGAFEQRALLPGVNTAATPVTESVARVRPVWQRRLTSPVHCEDYVMWAPEVDTPCQPAMAAKPGYAWHFGVIRGTPGGALVVNGHGRTGNFFNSIFGTGTAGESVVSPDDYTLNLEGASWYQGYQAAYDPFVSTNGIPTSGVVVPYTERRVLHAIAWLKLELGCDPARVYTMGSSMGATMGFFLAWHHPELIAAYFGLMPKICFGDWADPTVTFPWQQQYSRLWGTPSTNLPTSDGERVYDRLDGRSQARLHTDRGATPMLLFFGRHDLSSGWREKVDYLAAARTYHAGGTIFFDGRTHEENLIASWLPMQDALQLYSWRLDKSYVAFSNGSADGQAGNGDPAVGDSVGTISGYLQVGSTCDDDPSGWCVSLSTRSVSTRWHVFAAPESVTVDVTPRRMPSFHPGRNTPLDWRVTRQGDGALIQSGTVRVDDDGSVTIPGVKVLRTGVKLVIGASSVAVAPAPADARLTLDVANTLLRSRVALAVNWRAGEDAELALFDVGGRRLRTLRAGAPAGPEHLEVSRDGLAPGLYLLRARQAGESVTRRIVVVP